MYLNANEEMLAGNADADLCIRSMFLFFTYKTPSFNDYFIHVRNIENEQLKNCT